MKNEEKADKISKKILEQKKMATKKRKKHKIIAISIVAVILITLFISTIFALVNMNNEKILKGISIEGIDVSNQSKDEVTKKLEEIYNTKLTTEIKIKHNDYETSINPNIIETNYNINKAVEEAYNIGKTQNIFKNNYQILATKLKPKNIQVEMTINEDLASKIIDDINTNLPDALVESSYSVDNDELTISKGKAGVSIDKENFINEIKERLENINEKNDETIEIPVINKDPTPIDIEKIHNEICKDPQDAYYKENPFEIHPEVEGVSFDLEKAKELLQENKEEYVIKLTITKPQVTIEKIGSKAFPDELASFSTRYDVSDKDRSTNLELACKKINDTVVLSGDTFSYNKTVGARTSGAGYKNSKVYASGKVIDGIGGGICQISSTLYNAVLNANLEVVERKNHQFITSYVEPGMDATVAYGVTDFKFKNTRKYPIKILATAQNGIATVSIYGIKEQEEYTFKFDVKRTAVIPFTTKYVDDNTLAKGTQVVDQIGTNGLKTETYMTKFLNGKAVSTTLVSKDTYNAMTRIVRRGTKE